MAEFSSQSTILSKGDPWIELFSGDLCEAGHLNFGSVIFACHTRNSSLFVAKAGIIAQQMMMAIR